MQFSDTTNKRGLIQHIERVVFDGEYGAITGNTERLQTFTEYINDVLNEIANTIMTLDNVWQWDDTQYTDYPIATTTLNGGQQDYLFEVTFLKILGVEVRDSAGNYRKLKPLDFTRIKQRTYSVTEFREVDGFPEYYDLRSNSIFLYPAPSDDQVTNTAGLKVYYQRPPVLFDATDTTEVPGIPSTFHSLIGDMAGLRYAEDALLERKVNTLAPRVQRGRDMLGHFYSTRQVDTPRRITPKIRLAK